MKRAMDVAGSLVGLLLLSPVLAVVAIAVACQLGRPVLFRQQRPGRDARLFEMIKFRSMRPAEPGKANVVHDGDRLTPFGRRLRSSSLDELPTLWNVLRGDMSLVGPRPLLPDYLTLRPRLPAPSQCAGPLSDVALDCAGAAVPG
jgi:lipopolysaccharide/colanic/teichoic acid biosynthesis glycosyltransferase